MKNLLLFLIASAALVVPLRSDPPATGNALDRLKAEMADGHVPLIKSYSVDNEYKFVKIQLDPSVWENWSSSEQLRVCDALAKNPFLDRMNLLWADIYIDSTKIGKIEHTFGGGIVFTKDDRYWSR